MLTITRTPLTSSEIKIYTKKAVSCLLNVRVSDIEFISRFSDSEALVGLYNDSRTVSKKDAIALLIAERKSRSQRLEVYFTSKKEVYRVYSPDSQKVYTVTGHGTYLECECQDHKNLKEIFNSELVCCKHCYAVLQRLGYSSLKEYRARKAA